MNFEKIQIPSQTQRPGQFGENTQRGLCMDLQQNRDAAYRLNVLMKEDSLIKCVADLFDDGQTLITTTDKLKKYLSEVLIRFDTKPQFYTLSDYKALIALLIGSLLYLYGIQGKKIPEFKGAALLDTDPSKDLKDSDVQGIYIAQQTGVYENFLDLEGNPIEIQPISEEEKDFENNVLFFMPVLEDDAFMGYKIERYNIEHFYERVKALKAEFDAHVEDYNKHFGENGDVTVAINALNNLLSGSKVKNLRLVTEADETNISNLQEDVKGLQNAIDVNATPNTIAKRDANGALNVATATTETQATTKAQVDTALNLKVDKADVSENIVKGSIAKRTSTGTLKAAEPTYDDELTPKQYVDNKAATQAQEKANNALNDAKEYTDEKFETVSQALIFKGVFDVLPEVSDYAHGNVIIVDTKEYVLVEDKTAGTKKWIEIGDEAAYDTKGSAAAAQAAAAEYTDTKISNLNLDTELAKKVDIADVDTEVSGDKIAKRTSTGTLKVADPTADEEAATKSYVDTTAKTAAESIDVTSIFDKNKLELITTVDSVELIPTQSEADNEKAVAVKNKGYYKAANIETYKVSFENLDPVTSATAENVIDVFNKGLNPIFDEASLMLTDFTEMSFVDRTFAKFDIYGNIDITFPETLATNSIKIHGCPAYDTETYKGGYVTFNIKLVDVDGKNIDVKRTFNTSNTGTDPLIQELVVTRNSVQGINLSYVQEVVISVDDTDTDQTAFLIKDIEFDPVMTDGFNWRLWKTVTLDDISISDVIEPTEEYLTQTYRDINSNELNVINYGGSAKGLTKITSATGFKSGRYLIVYQRETDAYIFDSTLGKGTTTGINGKQNYIVKNLYGGTIPYTEDLDKYAFQINVLSEGTDLEISIKTAGGFYISNASTANNQIKCEDTVLTNTLTFDQGFAKIVSPYERTLSFNTQTSANRFRFYGTKSTTPEQIYLYRLGDSAYSWDKVVRESELVPVAKTNDYGSLNNTPFVGEIQTERFDTLPIPDVDLYANTMALTPDGEHYSVISGKGFRLDFRYFEAETVNDTTLGEFTQNVTKRKIFTANDWITDGSLQAIPGKGLQLGNASTAAGQIYFNRSGLIYNSVDVTIKPFTVGEACTFKVTLVDIEGEEYTFQHTFTAEETSYTLTCNVDFAEEVTIETDVESGRRGILESIVFNECEYNDEAFDCNHYWQSVCFSAKGEKGDTGARIVETTYIGTDANGGNIYKQTFDDGNSTSFTAPKGADPLYLIQAEATDSTEIPDTLSKVSSDFNRTPNINDIALVILSQPKAESSKQSSFCYYKVTNKTVSTDSKVIITLKYVTSVYTQGIAGVSPTITASENKTKTGYNLTFTDINQPEGKTITITNGANGSNGKDGKSGTSAGFGDPTTSVITLDAGSQANVVITATGDDTAKVFDFAFSIPRGDKGESGDPFRIVATYESIEAMEAEKSKHTIGDMVWISSSDTHNGEVYCLTSKDGVTTWGDPLVNLSGSQGIQGVTPKLRIVSDRWQVSYDDEKSWSDLGQAKGEKGDINPDSVLFTKQDLTEEQKAQARENIGIKDEATSDIDDTTAKKQVYQCGRVTSEEWESLEKDTTLKYIVTTDTTDKLYVSKTTTSESGEKTVTWEEVTEIDASALYTVNSEGAIYYYANPKFKLYGAGTEGSVNDASSKHFVTATVGTQLPTASKAYKDTYYIVGSTLFKCILRGRGYVWVTDTNNVLDLVANEFYNFSTGTKVVEENVENINYINDLTGDVYAYDASSSSFKLLTEVILDSTIQVNYSAKVSLKSALNTKLAAYKTTGVYTVIATDASTGKQTTYKLEVVKTGDTTYKQILTWSDGYMYRDFNAVWGDWIVKEYSLVHDFSFGLRTYTFGITEEYTDASDTTQTCPITDQSLGIAIHVDGEWLTQHIDNYAVAIYRRVKHNDDNNSKKWCEYTRVNLKDCIKLGTVGNLFELGITASDVMHMIYKATKSGKETTFADCFAHGCGKVATTYTHSIYKKGLPSHTINLASWNSGDTYSQCFSDYFGIALVKTSNTPISNSERMPMTICQIKLFGDTKGLTYLVSEYKNKKIY